MAENNNGEEVKFDEMSQEQLVEFAKEQNEKLAKEAKKAEDFKKGMDLANEKLKEAKNVVDPEPKPEDKPVEQPAAVTEDILNARLADAQLLAQHNITDPVDLQLFNQYRGNMSVADAVNDPNIKTILESNRQARIAQAQSEGLETVGGQIKETNGQWLARAKADPSILKTTEDRERYGRLIAQG